MIILTDLDCCIRTLSAQTPFIRGYPSLMPQFKLDIIFPDIDIKPVFPGFADFVGSSVVSGYPVGGKWAGKDKKADIYSSDEKHNDNILNKPSPWNLNTSTGTPGDNIPSWVPKLGEKPPKDSVGFWKWVVGKVIEIGYKLGGGGSHWENF